MAQPIIYIIEGPDSTGKNTQTQLLKRYLQAEGMNVATVEVPIRSSITHKMIYWLLKNNLALTYPRFFQTLQFVNKWWWLKTKFSSLKKHNDAIIFDRGHLSGYVYGFVSDPSMEKILLDQFKILDRSFNPKRIFILVGSPHVYEMRDEYEKNLSFQDRVCREFKACYDKEPFHNSPITLIDAGQTVQKVHFDISLIVQKDLDREI